MDYLESWKASSVAETEAFIIAHGGQNAMSEVDCPVGVWESLLKPYATVSQTCYVMPDGAMIVDFYHGPGAGGVMSHTYFTHPNPAVLAPPSGNGTAPFPWEKPSVNPGAIVAAVVGGVVLLGGAIYLLTRNRRKRRK